MARAPIFRTSFLVLFVLLGCRSTPVKTIANRPPPSTPAQKESWLNGYKEARAHQIDDVQKSCDLFTKLANDQAFPAHDVAHLRQVETCPQEAPVDRKLWPAWLQDQAIDVMLKVAAAHADRALEMEMALEKSKLKLPQAEKVKWMNLAI
jgi:hypothetical protein